MEADGVAYNGINFADAFVQGEDGEFYSFVTPGVEGTLAIYRFKVSGWKVTSLEKIAMLKSSVPFFRIDYTNYNVFTQDKLCVDLGDQFYMVDASASE